jgi:hypothetical protein
MADWDFSIRPAAFPFAKIGKKGRQIGHLATLFCTWAQSKQINFCRVYWLWKYSFF